MATGFRTPSAPTTGQHSSQDRLELLLQEVGSCPRYRSITNFYHVTKVIPKRKIIRTKMLCESLAEMTTSPSNRSPIHQKLSGVFFSCNLQKMRQALPDRSPFGTERITIPIAELADPGLRLFYNSHHTTRSDVYYVVLVLVKGSSPKYNYCLNHMIELDMKSNNILRLDFKRKKFEYCQPDSFSLWMELFFVGDIPLKGLSYSWDNVTDMGRHQSGSCSPHGYDDNDDDDDNSDDDHDDSDDDTDDYDDDDDPDYDNSDGNNNDYDSTDNYHDDDDDDNDDDDDYDENDDDNDDDNDYDDNDDDDSNDHDDNDDDDDYDDNDDDDSDDHENNDDCDDDDENDDFVLYDSDNY